MTVDILVILKSIKKMLDKGLSPDIKGREKDSVDKMFWIVSAENARDMLDELIKQLEIKPKLSPADQEVDTELSPEARAAKDAIL